MPVISDTFIIRFTPEQWGNVSRFQEFVGPPFDVTNKDILKGISIVLGHMNRHDHISNLANRILVTLPDDQKGIRRNRHDSRSEAQGICPIGRSALLRALLLSGRA